jgi:hypothetical protein
MQGETFSQKYGKRVFKNCPAFKEIRKVKNRCECCKRFGVVSICNRKCLCNSCYGKEKNLMYQARRKG